MLALLLGMAWAGPTVAIVRPAALDPAEHAPPCPPGRCAWLVLDEALCGSGRAPVSTVVLSGHSGPPQVLGRSPEELAELLACLEPELLVLDTCYGFSAPLLGALLDAGLAPLVVGTTDKLTVEGWRYRPSFFDEAPLSPRQRARHVRPRYGERRLVWVPDRASLEAGDALLASWGPDELEAALQRVGPNLVRVPVDRRRSVLVPVSPERFVRDEAEPAEGGGR